MKQAEHTLRSIEADLGFGSYSWACFKAQQAAELAIKAMLRAMGRPAFATTWWPSSTTWPSPAATPAAG